MKKAVAILLALVLLSAYSLHAFALQNFDPSAYSEEELRGFISQAKTESMERLYSDRAEIVVCFQKTLLNLGYEVPLIEMPNSGEYFLCRSEVLKVTCQIETLKDEIRFTAVFDADLEDKQSLANATTTAIIVALLYHGEKDVASDKLASIEEASDEFLFLASRNSSSRESGRLFEMFGYSIYVKLYKAEESGNVVLFMEIN